MKNKLVDDFTKNTSREFVAIVHALVDLLDQSGHHLTSAIKWRKLTFTMNEDYHYWLCSISISKKSVGLNFHYGGLLDDPRHLFKTGTSKFLRQLEFKRVEEINNTVICDFLGQAVNKLAYFKENWKEIQQAK